MMRGDRYNRWRYVQLAGKVALAALLFFSLFRRGPADNISPLAVAASEPVLASRGVVADALFGTLGFVRSKAALVAENRELRRELAEAAGKDVIIAALVADLRQVASGFGAGPDDPTPIIAPVLSTPPVSPYDTALIAAGVSAGVRTGDIAFSPGGIALGRVEQAFEDISRIRLFSSSGERTTAILSPGNERLELVGAGGGMMHATVPKDLVADSGDPVVLPDFRTMPLGTIEAIGTRSAGSLKVLFIRAAANVNDVGFLGIRPAPVTTHDEN